MKLASLIFLFFWVSISAAQEKKEPAAKDPDTKTVAPVQKDEPPLPKIELPEFVITGSEKIDLNIESKHEDDEERIFVGEKPTVGQRVAGEMEVVSPKQTKSFAQTPAGMNGKIFSGFGFYSTPQVNGWFGQHDERTSYMVNGSYVSTEGHVNDADGWQGGFGVRGRHVLPESSSVFPYAQLNGEIQYGRQSYHAYGSLHPHRVRDLSDLDLSFGVGSRYALPYRSLNSLDYTGTVGISNFSANDSARSTENDFYLGGVATTRFFDMPLRGQVEYRTTGYSSTLSKLQSGQWFLLKADGQTILAPSVQLGFTIQQFVYRGNFGAASGRFYPQIEIRYSMTESASMYAGFSPGIERNTLSSLTAQNRYIDFNSYVVPSDVRIRIHSGIEFNPVDDVTASVKYSYKSVNNYPIFLDSSGAKLWEVSYLSGVHSSKFDLSLLYRINPRQNVTAFFSTQKVSQKDSSGSIPYIPSYSFGVSYHHYFDFGLHAEGLAEYNASRYTDFTNTHSNAGYMYMSAKGDIGLFDHFRGYVEVQNILNQHYYIWDGYLERTLYLAFGVSYNW